MSMGVVGQLISKEQIDARVREMAEQINRDMAGERVVVIGILKGAFVFCADLLRHLTISTRVDFMAVSSYGSATESSGVIRIVKDLDTPVKGEHVLLVEDIVDTGLTLRYLKEYLMRHHPASLRTAVLLDKPSRRLTDVSVEYVGFTIPDHFVVGYGIDWAEQYRNLPYIGIVGEK